MPALGEVVERYRDKNVFFSTDVQGAIKKADIIFAPVDTPTDEADLRFI